MCIVPNKWKLYKDKQYEVKIDKSKLFYEMILNQNITKKYVNFYNCLF